MARLYFTSGSTIRKIICGVITLVGLVPSPPLRLAVDSAGAVFASMGAAAGIYRVDPSGAVTRVVSGGTDLYYTGAVATDASVDVRGLAIDGTGRLIFTTSIGVFAVAGVAAPPAAPGTVCRQLPGRAARGWGWNAVGQLGDGTTADKGMPTAPSAATVPGAAAVAAGGYHSLALKADGTVWAWGWNAFGQLGDGTVTSRTRPMQVTGLPPIASIAAGTYHSLAVGQDGRVWAWGWNPVGQLGDGTTVDRKAPVLVAGLSAVKGVSGGGLHSLAVKTDGTVWSWGWNGVGQLGDGTTVDRHAPVQVPYLSDMTAVAAGGYHSLALHRLGVATSWGWNGQGQLGIGSTEDKHYAVVVPGLTGVTALAAGGRHSIALLADGTVSPWGWNVFGQLGDNSTTDRWSPVTVPRFGLTVVAIAAGGYHSLALLSYHQVLGSGLNNLGQAGFDPDLNPLRTTYAWVQAFPAATAIAAGEVHSLGVWDFAGLSAG